MRDIPELLTLYTAPFHIRGSREIIDANGVWVAEASGNMPSRMVELLNYAAPQKAQYRELLERVRQVRESDLREPVHVGKALGETLQRLIEMMQSVGAPCPTMHVQHEGYVVVSWGGENNLAVYGSGEIEVAR